MDNISKETVEECRKSAEAGDAKSQCNLGLMYSKGQGMPQGYDEVVKWYRKAGWRSGSKEHLVMILHVVDGGAEASAVQ